jgi:hypothetical protein
VLGLLVVLGLLLAACDASSSEGLSPLPAPTAADGDEADSALEEAELVREDLAAQLGVSADEIAIVRVSDAEWPNNKLICDGVGKPGSPLADPEKSISLEYSGESYTYLTGGNSFVLCQAGETQEGTETKPEAGAKDKLGPIMEDLVEQAKDDLSQRMGIGLESIMVLSAEKVQWRDSSLGCPEPGRAYLTVITPGALIRLEANGQVYEYHTDRNKAVYCLPTEESAVPEATEVSDDSDPTQGMVDKVRTDLATRLGIPEEQVKVMSVGPVEWPTSALGCPDPTKSYMDVITPGQRIVLSAMGKEYAYHTGGEAFVLCKVIDVAEPVVPVPPTEPVMLDPVLEKLVAEAKTHLGQRLGIDPDEVALRSANAVDWRDSSLGCPEPGTGYMTVITPGYLILLEADGEVYEYHADYKRTVTCDDPQPPLDG